MRRRDVPAALLGTAAGGTFISSSSNSQTCAPLCRAQTQAEINANVSPGDTDYPEGDIRRYGAMTSATDNAAAINSALKVSSHGGNAAFIPGGEWKITSALNVVGESSMCGVGNGSIIVAQSCDGLTFGKGGNYAVTGTARFFRCFQIVGGNAASSTYHGIYVNFSLASDSRATGVIFENLYVANFAIAVYLRGLYNSSFDNCFLYNNYHGFYFYGQTITTSINNCNIQRGTIAGYGGAWGISFQSVAGETTQNTHISGGQVYFFDININVVLGFELQIEHCDISAAQSIGVQVTSTIGGFWLRDCWIETDKAAVTTGVLVHNITPSANAKINITGNYITCDDPYAGSQGIRVGNSNVGIVINENQIFGFDRGITLGASANLTCKSNTININSPVYGTQSYAICLDTLATDNEIGPNCVVPGAPQTASANGTANITVGNAATSFPVGTSVQFDRTAQGLTAGVAYFVVRSAGATIAVGSVAGGTAITVAGNGAIGNVFAQPLPLTYTAGTPPGLSFHGRGSFIMTLTGFTTAVAGVVDWVASGRFVALTMRAAANLAGISNTTDLQASGIPVFLRPITTQHFMASVEDSGTLTYGLGELTPTGLLSFYKTLARGTFTDSGTKGINSTPMIYLYT